MVSQYELESYTLKGSREINEDALIVNKSGLVFGVVDGATSVTPYKDVNGNTGGAIASNLLAKHMEEMNDSSSLVEAVLQANRELRQLMVQSGIDISDKTKLWSAAFAIVRVNQTKLEYVQAADSMVFVKYIDGTIRALSHDQVSSFDTLTIKKSLVARDLGLSSDEQFSYCLPTIRDNRKKANTLGGYSVLNGEEAFADFLEYGAINISNVERIYLVTDGLFYPKTINDSHTDFMKMINMIDQEGILNYINTLTSLEELDPNAEVYPRLKKSDDKTGIMIDLRKAGC
ncbi:protein phosphatase 2C domain-containing protein [Oceanobacillus chungangensis]|uniref:protein phosphatase 2C domain-containing protein n=1 Tax=Oceanobacillus chungangensis TaxID=1229152 RepID=UPI0014757332|nr:protein phosphatase 2C domain-containing protein [Oceanobacillus chungangensis]